MYQIFLIETHIYTYLVKSLSAILSLIFSISYSHIPSPLTVNYFHYFIEYFHVYTSKYKYIFLSLLLSTRAKTASILSTTVFSEHNKDRHRKCPQYIFVE